MFANDEFGKNIREFKKSLRTMNLEKIFMTLKKCSRTMNLEKIFVTLIKWSRTMNSEKIFVTLIKSSLTFFKVRNFCGSRTFFSIPTNNICGSRTYFQIYCLWTFLKSRIFFPYSRTFFWINEHFYYSRTRGIFDAKDFQIFFVHIFLFFALFTMPTGHLEGVSEILDLDDTLTVLQGPKWRFS